MILFLPPRSPLSLVRGLRSELMSSCTLPSASFTRAVVTSQRVFVSMTRTGLPRLSDQDHSLELIEVISSLPHPGQIGVHQQMAVFLNDACGQLFGDF